VIRPRGEGRVFFGSASDPSATVQSGTCCRLVISSLHPSPRGLLFIRPGRSRLRMSGSSMLSRTTRAWARPWIHPIRAFALARSLVSVASSRSCSAQFTSSATARPGSAILRHIIPLSDYGAASSNSGRRVGSCRFPLSLPTPSVAWERRLTTFEPTLRNFLPADQALARIGMRHAENAIRRRHCLASRPARSLPGCQYSERSSSFR